MLQASQAHLKNDIYILQQSCSDDCHLESSQLSSLWHVSWWYWVRLWQSGLLLSMLSIVHPALQWGDRQHPCQLSCHASVWRCLCLCTLPALQWSLVGCSISATVWVRTVVHTRKCGAVQLSAAWLWCWFHSHPIVWKTDVIHTCVEDAMGS